MTQMPGCRIEVGVIQHAAPLLGRGPVAALVEPHPYLDCFRCGGNLHHGIAVTGAPLLVCTSCNSVADKRRVD